MHQLLLGAAIPLVLGLIIYIAKGLRAPLWLLLILPPLMIAGAIWAVMPDVPRLIGWHALYQKMQVPASDIFFWHYTIDRIEANRLDAMAPFFNVVAILLPALLLGIAWRELWQAEQKQEQS